MSTMPARASNGSHPGINDDIGEEMRLTRTARRSSSARPSSAPTTSSANLVKGTSHLSLGQEAWRRLCLRDEARRPVVLHLSRHAHTLAARVPVEKVLASSCSATTG